jgi:hypothetical protein
VNYPGVRLFWPCVLPQWRPCVRGLAVRKRSRGGLQHPLHCVLGDAVKSPGVRLSGLACFLSGDLASQDLRFEKDREAACSTRVARIFETWSRIAPAFPLSGLACFLSGDLVPQDLWNSKEIEKAAVLFPNLFDYLLALISKFKVLAMIFNQYTIVSSSLYS